MLCENLHDLLGFGLNLVHEALLLLLLRHLDDMAGNDWWS